MPAAPNKRQMRRFAAGTALAAALLIGGCGGSSQPARRADSPSPAHPRLVRARSPAGPTALRYRSLYALSAPVEDPGAAPLPGGRFVLLGGLTAADTSADAVIVGSGAGARPTAKLPNAQHDAEAATLRGTVYLFGGGQFAQYAHILAFDPAAGTVTTAGALPQPASDVAVTGDGRSAYIVGGFNGSSALDTVLAYTPGAPPRVIARLPVALRYAAAAVAGGRLIVAGGSTPAGEASDAIFSVDPSSGQVHLLGHLPEPLTHAGAGTLGTEVYLVGGRGASLDARTAAVLAIDPRTGRVRAVGRLPKAVSDAAVIPVDGGLVVAGGRAGDGVQAGVGKLVPDR